MAVWSLRSQVGLGASDREDTERIYVRAGRRSDGEARRVEDIRLSLGLLGSSLSFTERGLVGLRGRRAVSNNSWGNGTNAYDAVAQEYDALARDAQPGVPGNQEMVFVFSAGNGGGRRPHKLARHGQKCYHGRGKRELQARRN